MARAVLVAVVSCASFGTVAAETLKISSYEQGAAFANCIKITDFETKTVSDDVDIAARDGTSGCCPEGYVPGAKHYSSYFGAQIICGFTDTGKVALSSSSSNGVKSCTYNSCYVLKNGHACADGTAMKLNGCCGADNKNTNYVADCKMYSKSFTSVNAAKSGAKVSYCLSYHKKYKMEGTSDKTDDQADGKLQVDKLYIYTGCTGAVGASATGGSSPAPASGPAPASASPSPATGSGKMVISGVEITCDHKVVKTTVDGMEATFKNYKSCDEKTQQYILEVSGYETKLIAGKNGNWNSYGSGMMCKDGNMYWIYTVDTKQSTWDGLKEGKYDGVAVQCLLKEGSSSSDTATTSSAQAAGAGVLAVLAVVSAM